MSETIAADVCVMGAGPVGGTLACRLAAAGVATAVVDRAALPPMEHPRFDGRAYAIAAGSRPVLEAAGLWDRLPFAPNPILDIRVSDARLGRSPSRLFLHFAHHEAKPGAGPFGWMVEARSLRMALNTQMREMPALRVFSPAAAVAERRKDGVTVRVAGGPEIRCRLVVAAEGRDSPLREAAGIAVTRFPYRQSSIICAVSHDKPHHDVALENFLPTGPFAALPMGPSVDAQPGGARHVSAIVWTEDSEVAEQVLQFDDARLAREIVRRLGDHLGAVRIIGHRWRYPLSAMLAHDYTARRLALAGDAAHGIHPVAGQGLNLGFRDAIALSDLVIEAVEAGADPGGAQLLARYQQRRRGDNLLMLVITDGLDRLFSNDVRLLRLARDGGIATVGRMGGLKRAFMRRAMGQHLGDSGSPV